MDKAFPPLNQIKTEDGKTYLVSKWSVRKFTTMGRALSTLIESIFSMITSGRRNDYAKALEQAKAQGLNPESPAWPQEGHFEHVAMQDIVAAIPAAIQSATDEFAFIVSQSLTSHENGQVSPDTVLDDFTLDDLAEAMQKIVDINLKQGSMGKWKGLLGVVMEKLSPGN